MQLWYNGTIYAGEGRFIEAFVTEGETIRAAGTLSDMEAFCRDAAGSCGNVSFIRRDLEGRFVCAGFNDSHMHLLSLGRSLTNVNLAHHTGSLREMLSFLREFLLDHPVTEGDWLAGRGWNHEAFTDERRLPNRYDLDQVSTEIPIYLSRACGHIAVVNSRALALMGLTADTPQTADASFDLDENGEPTGILRENAIVYATRLIPSPSRAQIKEMLAAAGQLANGYGITSVQTDDLTSLDNIPYEEVLSCFHELQDEGRLHLRVNEQCLLPDMDALKHFLSEGYRTGTGSEWFRIGPLKLILDGSLGAHTAYMQQDYADLPGERGMALYTKEDLTAMTEYAHRNGMQIAIHAIGDGAVALALSGLRSAQEKYPRDDARHGIVHCQLTTAEQLNAFRELSLHAYIQSIFLDADAPIVNRRVSPDLAASSYQAASYLANGVYLSNGSDAPVELPDVLAGIQCAVTRMPLNGQTPPYLPQEALTVAQAIDSFTCLAAHASFEENIKGRIAPGMLADFVILEKSPFDTPVQELKDIAIAGVILGGDRIR